MKGLFLFCSLLSLVGFTNSLSDKGQLAKVKESHHQLKEKLEKMKNDRLPTIDSSSDLLNDYINLMDPWTELMKKYAGEFYEDFLPLEALMRKTKDFLVKTKSSIDKTNDDLGVQIETLERQLKQSEILINFLEEQEAEL